MTTRDEARIVLDMMLDDVMKRALRRTVKPGTRLVLGFSGAERRMMLDSLVVMELAERQQAEFERADPPALAMTLANWEVLQGAVAAE
jgi:hypothetical protein